MSDKPATATPATNGSPPGTGDATAVGTAPKDAPKPPPRNPAFKAMGLPRLRLPSRNWLIFLSITGSFASAVLYDKYQTRRVNEKWTRLVSHIANEPLDNKSMPRKMTIYLSAPPGDGLRAAREHFHIYIKPVLVAAAMDWDVVEGRKEGDVRYKTAERIRKKRKRAGEGVPMTEEELESMSLVDTMRERAGTHEFDGIAGDLVVGRNTWKEYIRGLHEGWLGPADSPKEPESEAVSETTKTTHTPGQPSIGDAAVKAAVNTMAGASEQSSNVTQLSEFVDDASPGIEAAPDEGADQEKKLDVEEKKNEEEDEKPKPRQPPPYIDPTSYSTATVSRSIPDIIGPSMGLRFPHVLGFRNTPIRVYRFLNRRHLADSIGRDVATAVLAAHRPYSTVSSDDELDGTSGSSEQTKVLQEEENNWWKTTFQPRKEHEESVWIEDMILDERITSRMRAFQLTAEDEDRARRIGDGREPASLAEE